MSAAVVAFVGCDEPPADGDAGLDVDAAPIDGGVRRDSGRPCTTDGECDDGIDCTRDVCDPLGFCRNAPETAVCDDMVFCNGVEQCDTTRGCIPGPRQTCNDDQVCTIDRCNEETKTCDHSVRDLDEDGDADFFCEGGSDCDDRDPLRSSTVPEICDDTIDNDCDDLVDEATCGRPPYDTCDNPLDVSAGGVFIVNTSGATPDYTLGCAASMRQDLVLTFTIADVDAPRDVRIEAEGDFFSTAVALRTTCTDRATELDCSTGFPGTIRRRGLGAGTYFVVLHGYGAGEIAVTVELSEPTPPPTNETCATPIDVSAGGTFMGTMLDVDDDLTTGCGFSGSPDLVYAFTTTAERDVRISATATTGESVAWEVRPTCESAAGAVRCAYGGPASGRIHQLPAGTYYLVLEGPSHTEVDFTLSVEFLDPTPPLAGDQCSNAIPLTLGTPTTGSLTDMEDDLDTSCGFRYRDVVYSFTLPVRRDVSIDIAAGTTFMNASVRTACAEGSSQLRCSSGGPLRMRLRDLAAGTYYVVVEALRAATFTIGVTDTAPTTAVAVTGNDTCATAHVVPATGGLFTGTTVALADDVRTASCGGMAQSPDAVFQLVLTSRQRVIASTDGSTFDTVLHVHNGMCRTGAETACDDDGGEGSTSLLDRTLDAGTYYYVVDGWGMVSSGSYVFEVLVSDP
ncbi:MAG: MopE-related protein [Myxococcota bacterium]|nr:MopE-related protein [Myxococcota bacterium]